MRRPAAAFACPRWTDGTAGGPLLTCLPSGHWARGSFDAATHRPRNGSYVRRRHPPRLPAGRGAWARSACRCRSWSAAARAGRGEQGARRPLGDHDLQSRRAEPDGHVRPEAGRAGRDSRAVQADRDEGRTFRSPKSCRGTPQVADKFSLVRSCYHTAAAVHDTGHQMMQTGRLFTGGINTPHVGCALAYLRGRKTDLPPHVILPEPMGPTGGNLPHGQDAGFLGKAYDPFVLMADPSAAELQVPDLLPPQGAGRGAARAAAPAAADRRGARSPSSKPATAPS